MPPYLDITKEKSQTNIISAEAYLIHLYKHLSSLIIHLLTNLKQASQKFFFNEYICLWINCVI